MTSRGGAERACLDESGVRGALLFYFQIVDTKLHKGRVSCYEFGFDIHISALVEVDIGDG